MQNAIVVCGSAAWRDTFSTMIPVVTGAFARNATESSVNPSRIVAIARWNGVLTALLLDGLSFVAAIVARTRIVSVSSRNPAAFGECTRTVVLKSLPSSIGGMITWMFGSP